MMLVDRPDMCSQITLSYLHDHSCHGYGEENHITQGETSIVYISQLISAWWRKTVVSKRINGSLKGHKLDLLKSF